MVPSEYDKRLAIYKSYKGSGGGYTALPATGVLGGNYSLLESWSQSPYNYTPPACVGTSNGTPTEPACGTYGKPH